MNFINKLNEYWDNRSLIYDKMMEENYKETNKETILLMRKYLREDFNVLDFACGTGFLTLGISKNVSSITSIDLSCGMIKKAEENKKALGIKNAEFKNISLFDPSLKENSFDAVLAGNVLCYLKDIDKELFRIFNLLKPQGVFLSVTDCLKEDFSKEAFLKFIKVHTNKMPFEKFYTKKELINVIEKSGFKIEESKIIHNKPANLFIASKKDSL